MVIVRDGIESHIVVLVMTPIETEEAPAATMAIVELERLDDSEAGKDFVLSVVLSKQSPSSSFLSLSAP